MAKPVWRICAKCHEKFVAPDDEKLAALFESHFVTTPDGQRCMSQGQLLRSFNRIDKSWVNR